MISVKNICKSIEVLPVHLDSNILKTVISILKEKYQESCDEEHGILISVEDIINISNIVNKDTTTVDFTVEFTAKVVKPEKNLKISFCPSLILPKGVFGKLYNNINIFIPEVNFKEKGWIFQDGGSLKKGKNVIKKDVEVEAIITDIKFDVTRYNCIAQLF